MLKRALRLLAQSVLPLVVLLVAYVVTDALITEEPPSLGRKAEEAEVTFAVRAINVSPGPNQVSFRAFGEVVPAGLAELRVASPGEVVDMSESLAVGRIVEEGETLLTIDPFSYEGDVGEARAQLAEARAAKAEVEARIRLEEVALQAAEDQLAFAQRDLGRAQRLSETGTLADRALDERSVLVSERRQARDQRRFTLEAERARLAQNEATIERLEWQVRRAERALEDTKLVAPFRGIVRDENVEVGRLLSVNDLAVSLVRVDALDVAFTLSDQRFGRLLTTGPVEGRQVSVTWRIGDTPLVFDATIQRAAADISADTGGVRLYARFPVPEQGPVPRPGAFVEVRVPGPVHEGTVRLPATALYGNDVYVIGPAERLQRRDAALMVRDGDEVIVRGPQDGDAVVTTRLAEAGEGIKVNRVDEDPTVALPEEVADAAEDEAAEPEPAGQNDREAAARSRS